MKRLSWFVFICLALVGTTPAWAQLPVPQLTGIYPNGARQATSVECAINGRDMTGATGLYFSHPAISAEPAGTNKFKVKVPAGVPVGRYDVRAICPTGVSASRSFVVGDRPEVVETEPNNEPAQAQRLTLPVVANGQISRGLDLDYFVFHAAKGQRILINCWAARIDSPLDSTLLLSDAKGKELAYAGDYYGKDALLDFTVPEDGDYTLKIWDFIYTGGPDSIYRLEIGSLPHLDAVLPAAIHPGEKSVVTLYGRNLPGGKPVPGAPMVGGRPLESITREVQAAGDAQAAASLHGGEAVRPPQTALDGMEYRLTTPEGTSNPLFIGFTKDPIVLEREPNSDLTSAQPLKVPCEISGMFSPVGDLDFFSFAAIKGERVIAEVYGERQSGLIDPMLVGLDSKGKRLMASDDNGQNIGQLRFTTKTRDAFWDFNVPTDGEYFLKLRDLYFQQRGEPRFTYRLSVRQPRPDFRLLAVPTAEVLPDATVVRRGGRYWLDMLVFRQDGFDEPILVEASALPPGVSCEPVTIGPGKTSVPLVFQASDDAPIGHAEIRITGKARLNDAEFVRVARSGSMVWPTVNTPGIARLVDATVLSVREPGPFSLSAAAVKTSLAPGDKVSIKVKIVRAADWSEDVQLSGFDLPTNATVPLVTVRKGATDGQVELRLAANTKPGVYSFTIQGSGQVPREYASQRDPSKPRGNNTRVVMPSNPVTITVNKP
jgi:hypothetical protein